MSAVALPSRQQVQATGGGFFRRHLSLEPGRAAAEGLVLRLSAALLGSLARHPGHEDDAAVAVRQADQRTVEVRTRRCAVRERDQGAVEARLGHRLVRYAERSAFGRPTDRPLVREPDQTPSMERRASQAAIGPANPGPNLVFLRRVERRASQTTADGPIVRRYERWAFRGVGT